MKIGSFVLTRDSLLLWLGILAGVMMYLGNMPVPTQWTTMQWVQAFGGVLAVLCAKLATSPLIGEKDL